MQRWAGTSVEGFCGGGGGGGAVQLCLQPGIRLAEGLHCAAAKSEEPSDKPEQEASHVSSGADLKRCWQIPAIVVRSECRQLAPKLLMQEAW